MTYNGPAPKPETIELFGGPYDGDAFTLWGPLSEVRMPEPAVNDFGFMPAKSDLIEPSSHRQVIYRRSDRVTAHGRRIYRIT